MLHKHSIHYPDHAAAEVVQVKQQRDHADVGGGLVVGDTDAARKAGLVDSAVFAQVGPGCGQQADAAKARYVILVQEIGQ